MTTGYPQWTKDTRYEVGEIVDSIPRMFDGAYAFRCITAGDSGSDQPAFPSKITETVVDNEVVWQTISTIYNQLYQLEPSALIELFEIHMTQATNGVDAIYRFHAGTNEIPVSIVFDSKTYTAAPVEADGFTVTTKGAMPRPTLRLANLDGAISSIIGLYNPLRAKVKRIRTCKKFLDEVNFFGDQFIYQNGDVAVTQDGLILVFATHDTDDPTARFPDETFYIDRISTENRDVVEFELTSSLDISQLELPRRRVVEHCQWTYREPTTCSYSGVGYTVNSVTGSSTQVAKESVTDICPKTLEACKLRFGDGWLPFGGFPSVSIQE